MKHQAVLDDLAAEHASLAAVLELLSASDGTLPTPAAGWSVADQVSHLRFFDQRAAMAMTDAEAFAADRAAIIARAPHDPSTDFGRSRPWAELLGEWHHHSETMRALARDADESARVPWYGPSMSVTSFLTARLMETWAHGHDVCVATGHSPIVSPRLRHVAHIGYSARPFSLAINRLPADDRPVRLELTAPDGQTWTWGPSDADDRVIGDAYDFCLVVTQRRLPSDSRLAVTGDSARRWIDVAQAFAGAPGRR